ncbi:DegT/DnrJ/EryC1/StrS family aminotransferase [Saccharicrinis sp. GN24d3]|uniref:DegT/DnrJ/EryC1/StrS family aminotransferase n=1 Tax=Saccharicrinis sp. GN24d3 TaxID=3458416 RepID=UPI0040370D2C
MFIINPDPYSLPCYRIGPFRTSDLAKNHNLPDNNSIDRYFDNRFGENRFVYTENGRGAINLALERLDLKSGDVVTILTTSGNFYISGCVTKEIEKFCLWSREFTPDTKAIFLNHEFGFPYEHPEKLKEYGLPIIEDCANTFFSKGIGADPGTIGDYVIYSFPKTFPLQVGGLLVGDNLNGLHCDSIVNMELLRYIKNVLSEYIDHKDVIVEKRMDNYNYLKYKFHELGFPERFALTAGVMPGVFMFKSETEKIDLPNLKKYYYNHGVQCSVFYGEEAFFIPVHQELNQEDLDYFVEIFKSFLKSNNNQ